MLIFQSHKHLVSEQLYTPCDICDEDEVLDGSCMVDVDLCVNEGHTHQILVVLEMPHENLGRRGGEGRDDVRMCEEGRDVMTCEGV